MMTPRAPSGSGAAKEAPEADKATAGDDSKNAAAQRRDPKEEARANERKKRKRYTYIY